MKPEICPICGYFQCFLMLCDSCDFAAGQRLKYYCTKKSEKCKCTLQDLTAIIIQLKVKIINLESENYNLHQMVTQLIDRLRHLEEL